MPPAEWSIEDYEAADGGTPIRDFMSGLTPQEQGRIGTRLKYLRLRGVLAGKEVIVNVKGKRGDPRTKLWELRMPKSQHNPRILLFAAPGHKLVLLHGLKKVGRSNDKIPEGDIAIAVERMSDYVERHGTR